MLSGLDPVVWDIQWTKGTDILGVMAFGQNRQAIAGLPNSTPIAIDTYNRCGEESVYTGYRDDSLLERLSQQLFGKPLAEFDSMYDAASFSFGEPLTEDSVVLSSNDTSVDSFMDSTAPRVRELGIQDAIDKGILRQATEADLKAWVNTHLQTEDLKYEGEAVTSEAEKKTLKDYLIRSSMTNIEISYVVLNEFTYPAGLHGAYRKFFFVPEGVAKPQGNPGHSNIYDLSTGECFNACAFRY